MQGLNKINVVVKKKKKKRGDCIIFFDTDGHAYRLNPIDISQSSWTYIYDDEMSLGYRIVENPLDDLGAENPDFRS